MMKPHLCGSLCLALAAILFLPEGILAASPVFPKLRKKSVNEFRALDRNGDGSLTFDEWRLGFRGRPSRVWHQFAELDRNRNRKVSLLEFARTREVRPKPGQRPSDPPRPRPVPDFSRYVGLTLEEARGLAESEGRRHRLVSLDGVPFPVTKDYWPDRVNFTVVSGLVTEARGF